MSSRHTCCRKKKKEIPKKDNGVGRGQVGSGVLKIAKDTQLLLFEITKINFKMLYYDKSLKFDIDICYILLDV
jgi:hypothetical protein